MGNRTALGTCEIRLVVARYGMLTCRSLMNANLHGTLTSKFNLFC